jgi:hypothetical protein
MRHDDVSPDRNGSCLDQRSTIGKCSIRFDKCSPSMLATLRHVGVDAEVD